MTGIIVKHRLAAAQSHTITSTHTCGARRKLSEPREPMSPPKQRETKAVTDKETQTQRVIQTDKKERDSLTHRKETTRTRHKEQQSAEQRDRK